MWGTGRKIIWYKKSDFFPYQTWSSPVKFLILQVRRLNNLLIQAHGHAKLEHLEYITNIIYNFVAYWFNKVNFKLFFLKKMRKGDFNFLLDYLLPSGLDISVFLFQHLRQNNIKESS